MPKKKDKKSQKKSESTFLVNWLNSAKDAKTHATPNRSTTTPEEISASELNTPDIIEISDDDADDDGESNISLMSVQSNATNISSMSMQSNTSKISYMSVQSSASKISTMSVQPNTQKTSRGQSSDINISSISAQSNIISPITVQPSTSKASSSSIQSGASKTTRTSTPNASTKIDKQSSASKLSTNTMPSNRSKPRSSSVQSNASKSSSKNTKNISLKKSSAIAASNKINSSDSDSESDVSSVVSEASSILDTEHRTIKIKLNNIIADDAYKKAKMDYINTLVLDMSKATFDAYNFANYFVLKAIESNENIPAINQQFFVYCLNVVTFKTDNRGKPAIKSNFMSRIENEYKELVPMNYQVTRTNRTHLLSEIAEQMETNAVKYLKQNFVKRAKNYYVLKYCVDHGMNHRSTKQKGIAKKAQEVDINAIYELNKKLKKLKTDDGDDSTKSIAFQVLKLYHQAQAYFAQHQATFKSNTENPPSKMARSYSLLPFKKGFSLDYIRLSNTNICDGVKIKEELNATNLNDFFSIKKIRINKSNYSLKSILTDGYSASVVFEKIVTPSNTVPQANTVQQANVVQQANKTRPANKTKQPNTVQQVNTVTQANTVLQANVVQQAIKPKLAFDPGVRQLVGVSNKQNNKTEFDYFKLNTSHYRHLCLINNFQFQIRYKTFQSGIVYSEIPNHKVSSSKEMLAYMEYFFKTNKIHQLATNTLTNDGEKKFQTNNIRDILFEFNQKNNSRKYRFRVYVEKQKIKDYIVSVLRNYELYWGDWSITKTQCIRGNRMFNIGLQKYLRSKSNNIQLLDEFNTSKLCYQCEKPMINAEYLVGTTRSYNTVAKTNSIQFKNLFQYKSETKQSNAFNQMYHTPPLGLKARKQAKKRNIKEKMVNGIKIQYESSYSIRICNTTSCERKFNSKCFIFIFFLMILY